MLAGDSEEKDEREGGEHHAGHHDGVVGEVRALQGCRGNGEHAVLVRAENKHGPEVVGPLRDEREQEQHRGRRPGCGHRHRDEGAEHGTAVHARRFDQLVRQGVLQVLRHPEHAERTDQTRNDHGPDRTEQSGLVGHDVQRYDAQLLWDGHGADHNGEQHATAAEPQFGK